MNGMNKVILLGNLGADPELRYTTNGIAVLSLRLATNESFVDKNKEPQQRTEWHNAVVWGARAEAVSKLVSKGACVLVEGSLRTSSYEKDGVKRYKTEVHARDVLVTNRHVPGSETSGPPEAALATLRMNGLAAAKKEPLLDELPY